MKKSFIKKQLMKYYDQYGDKLVLYLVDDDLRVVLRKIENGGKYRRGFDVTNDLYLHLEAAKKIFMKKEDDVIVLENLETGIKLYEMYEQVIKDSIVSLRIYQSTLLFAAEMYNLQDEPDKHYTTMRKYFASRGIVL